MDILAAILVTLAALVAPALVLLGIPGAWLALAVAGACAWWRDALFDWRTLAAAAGVALLAELAELSLGLAGAHRAGGSKRSFIGVAIGGLVGAVLGTALLPVLGTILFGAAGAGLGAALAQRTKPGPTGDWRAAAAVARGAASGWLLAVVVKSSLASVVAAILIVGAWRA